MIVYWVNWGVLFSDQPLNFQVWEPEANFNPVLVCSDFLSTYSMGVNLIHAFVYSVSICCWVDQLGNDGSPNLPTSLQNLHVGDTSTSSSTKYCFSVFSPIQRSVTGMIPHGPVSILCLQEMRLPAVPALTLHARNLSRGQGPTSNCGCCAFSQLCFSMFQKPVTTMLIMLSWIRAILKKFHPVPTLTIRQPCNHGTGPKPQMPSQCY